MIQARLSVDRRNDVNFDLDERTWQGCRQKPGVIKSHREAQEGGTYYSWRTLPSQAERLESLDRGRHSQLCVFTHLHLETLTNAPSSITTANTRLLDMSTVSKLHRQ